MKLQIYDPPMCCASGVCGANIDPVLLRFSIDLQWLISKGIDVERHNLMQDPAEFKNNEMIKRSLAAEGKKCLPIILVNGAIVSKGVYPSRDELAGYFSLEHGGPGELEGKDPKSDPCCQGGKC